MKPQRILFIAAACLSASIAARADQPRVFYAPAERARITAERAALLGKTESLRADGVVSDAAPASVRKPVGSARLEGVSQARGGNAHAWIGGARYDDGSLYDGQRLRVRHNGVVLTSATGVTRLFRVGESIAEGASAPADPGQ